MGGVKHEVEQLKQDMNTFFPIVTGLHQLASVKEEGAAALRGEFQKGLTEGTENVAALRADVGGTVGLLVSAVKADRLQTKKRCQAVVNLQISGKSTRETGQEKGRVMQPLRCNQVEDQGKAVQPRTSTVPRRLFAAESAPVPAVAAPPCPLPSSYAPVRPIPLAAPIHYPSTEWGVEGVVARTHLQPQRRTV